MAPTSLPGGGFGVYTTRHLDPGEAILAAPDGPAVPLWDPSKNSLQLQAFRHTYWWSNGAGDFNLLTGGDVTDNQNTLGALPNHHCMLSTIQVQLPDVEYDDSVANRFVDPGAGAFSYGLGREFTSDGRAVQAGEELFLSYVPCDERIPASNTKLFGWQHDIPLTEHFLQAAHMVQDVWRKAQTANVTRDERIEWPRNHRTNHHVAPLLPATYGDVESIVQHAASLSSQDLAVQVAKHALPQRSVDWIQQHGVCIEHLVPLPSIIPQAGMGGVAQFGVQKGEVVVPAPLLHMDRRNAMDMHLHDDEESPRGKQLLLNYCLGHEDSDILLYPDTNAILINHCSNRGQFAQYCPDGPNAAFQWSSGWDPMSEEWKRLSVDEIMKRTVRGLSMEVVALRDIQPGTQMLA